MVFLTAKFLPMSKKDYKLYLYYKKHLDNHNILRYNININEFVRGGSPRLI